MLDRITLASTESIGDIGTALNDYLIRIEPISQTKFHSERCMVWRGGQRLFALHSSSRGLADETRIEFNPNWYSGFNEFKGQIKKLIDLKSCRIVRLDSAIDLTLPTNEVFESISFGRKLAVKQYSRELEIETFYCGKYPESVCVYDKAKQNKLEGPLTRIEVRQFSKKIPIKKLDEIEKLIEHNPFHMVQPMAVIGIPENTQQLEKIEKWIQMKELVGAHMARKKLNKSYNWARDYGGLIGGDPNFPNVFEQHKKELMEWIEG